MVLRTDQKPSSAPDNLLINDDLFEISWSDRQIGPGAACARSLKRTTEEAQNRQRRAPQPKSSK